ncbi:hypothetical protein NA57DRAFT_36901 [Rhizodiscina lignyota]|uniref:Cyclase n=1 Tax=Rhizodiscina lignyota TaxID=1504668 RepID=A0A9P4IM80_9PEZI|nr:hypothetical protein NA57DRAFT_36901 [Rhizodiscina lignyota]
MDASKLPLYKDMPPVKGMPHGCAWGLFDKNDVKDEIGTLNLLTPEVVAEAAKEIKTGKSVCLSWSLEYIKEPGYNRLATKHKIVNWREFSSNWSYDDELSINTQSGSQWDGLRHWAYQETGQYYQGIHHDELLKTDHIGTDHWCERGGIVGRGVLIDYVSWAQRKGVKYDPWTTHRIPISDVQAIAEEQGLKFRPGDILLVRTGFTKKYEESSREERLRINSVGEYVGVDSSPECVEWLWNNHFAAVAGDSIGFEAWPAKDVKYRLHDTLLAMWGMPLGEMWDLEELARECERQKRWSFFLTSCPLKIKGGVASPPNAIAVF